MNDTELETFCPSNRTEWREWLKENHQTHKSIWVIFYKKSTQIPTVSWPEAVEEALCFGWIDSTKKTIDDQKFRQFFSPRKAKSNWSKINKAKVQQLIENSLMTEAGQRSIDVAKENGSWTILDAVEDLIVPDDLTEALSVETKAKEYFSSLSNSKTKQLLYWIMSAKRAETRTKRIAEIVEAASEGLLPKPIR